MTAIVWLRRDLRVHDHPPLVQALAEHDRVVPLFVLDPALLGGRHASVNRTAYLFDSLRALDGELRARGAKLVVREGRPERVVPQVAAETGARRVYAAGDVSRFARRRDARVARHVDLVVGPGLFIAHLGALRRKDGGAYRVYAPFRRAWAEQPRRAVLDAPDAIPMPRIAAGELPRIDAPPLVERPEPGEAAALARARDWMATAGTAYDERRNVLAEPPSRMSQYLHFGSISPRVLEETALGAGASTYRRELAWRDFYAYVLLYEHVSRPNPAWSDDAEALRRWAEGTTGFPVVDAAMRQLRACGWMHNRARMFTASFLTKDLHIDWRAGEAHFMKHLIDGDMGSNNGGWQWVAGTGTDPWDFTRVFNPSLQQERFDPEGVYVRRWVPELARVPLPRLSKPWTMSPQEQEAAGCVIGRDYPAPVVDHAEERRRAIEAYRAVVA
jgi:deoxyribodipyrimidine photo-lyase